MSFFNGKGGATYKFCDTTLTAEILAGILTHTHAHTSRDGEYRLRENNNSERMFHSTTARVVKSVEQIRCSFVLTHSHLVSSTHLISESIHFNSFGLHFNRLSENEAHRE